MADKELIQFARQMMGMTADIHREFTRAQENELTRGVITLPQMNILDYLFQKKKCTMGDISDMLSVSMSAATGLTDRMIKNKMLKRSRGVEDRRIVWIALTPQGKKVAESVRRYKYNIIKRLFKDLSKTDREKYLDIIKKIHKSITKTR